MGPNFEFFGPKTQCGPNADPCRVSLHSIWLPSSFCIGVTILVIQCYFCFTCSKLKSKNYLFDDPWTNCWECRFVSVHKSEEEASESKKKLVAPLADGSYTQEEFEREFLEDDSGVVDGYDSDPRRVANFELMERNQQSVEQSAGTISSMQGD